jgi:hypothetical protein
MFCVLFIVAVGSNPAEHAQRQWENRHQTPPRGLGNFLGQYPSRVRDILPHAFSFAHFQFFLGIINFAQGATPYKNL